MAGAIGPGDFVESLIDCPAEYGFRAVSKGSLYCVDSLVQAVGPKPCSACGQRLDIGFLLLGDLPRIVGTGWCYCGFRPIYRPKAELTTSLLRKATEPSELEPA